MMRKYSLEITIDDEGLGIHEKTDEGMTIAEARLIMSVLEEYKMRILNFILFYSHDLDKKGKKKND